MISFFILLGIVILLYILYLTLAIPYYLTTVYS